MCKSQSISQHRCLLLTIIITFPFGSSHNLILFWGWWRRRPGWGYCTQASRLLCATLRAFEPKFSHLQHASIDRTYSLSESKVLIWEGVVKQRSFKNWKAQVRKASLAKGSEFRCWGDACADRARSQKASECGRLRALFRMTRFSRLSNKQYTFIRAQGSASRALLGRTAASF